MQPDNDAVQVPRSKDFIDAMIRLGLLAVLLALAYRLFMEWVGTGGATIENGADTAGNEMLQPTGGE